MSNPTLSQQDILDLYQDEMVGLDFFDVLEANNVHPGDIEELLGNETAREYERYLYEYIK